MLNNEQRKEQLLKVLKSFMAAKENCELTIMYNIYNEEYALATPTYFGQNWIDILYFRDQFLNKQNLEKINFNNIDNIYDDTVKGILLITSRFERELAEAKACTGNPTNFLNNYNHIKHVIKHVTKYPTQIFKTVQHAKYLKQYNMSVAF